MNTKAISNLLKHCKDVINPKWEITGVYVHGNKLVVTDTIQLLILEFEDNFTAEENIMLFAADDRRCARPKNLGDLLDANNCLLDTLGYRACSIENIGKFPDYTRIIPNKEFCNAARFNLDWNKDAADYLNYRCILLNNSLFSGKYLHKFCQLLAQSKMNFKIELCQKEAELPLMIDGKVIGSENKLVGFKYIVMPITIDADKRCAA